MDMIDAFMLMLECAVIGFGMALGDWLLKLIAVRFLNSQHHALHDVEDDEEEEAPAKKASKAKQPRERRAISGATSTATFRSW